MDGGRSSYGGIAVDLGGVHGLSGRGLGFADVVGADPSISHCVNEVIVAFALLTIGLGAGLEYGLVTLARGHGVNAEVPAMGIDGGSATVEVATGDPRPGRDAGRDEAVFDGGVKEEDLPDHARPLL